MSSTPPTAEIHDQVQRKLAEHEIRYTAGRRSVVATALLASGPRTAAELAAEPTNDLPVSSLYRSLSVLEDADILKKHHGADGIARYELSEWLTGHHHHVICVVCGAMEDIDISEAADQDIHALIMTLGAQSGYRVLDHVIEVEGVCNECE